MEMNESLATGSGSVVVGSVTVTDRKSLDVAAADAQPAPAVTFNAKVIAAAPTVFDN